MTAAGRLIELGGEGVASAGGRERFAEPGPRTKGPLTPCST
jgi:hypothetical protein